jgi:CxxC motif-containing protein (DUF1111 family)
MGSRVPFRFILPLFAVVGTIALVPIGDKSPPDFGQPLRGLTAEQLDRFNEGKDEFLDVETVEDGLGPVFNDVSCGTCHLVPAVGGGSDRIETRFGTRLATGQFDPLSAFGGSLIQEQGIGPNAECEYVGELVPAEATIRAGRRTTPLFGLGLVDAVPDNVFRQIAYEESRDPSLAGLVSVVTNLSTGRRAVGKFGWKAQVPTVFQFAGDAYVNEMGITSPQFPDENCPQGDCASLSCNPAPELNDTGDGVQAFADFMTFLAPPPRGPITAQASGGEYVFHNLGCASCHRPDMRTGSNAIAALNQVNFHPYSDFLLHDMGSLGDGITQNRATGRLMRTAPLWGVRKVTALLHDGRAKTLDEAIRAHDGQGRRARDRYLRLSGWDKDKLIAFLNSL